MNGKRIQELEAQVENLTKRLDQIKPQPSGRPSVADGYTAMLDEQLGEGLKRDVRQLTRRLAVAEYTLKSNDLKPKYAGVGKLVHDMDEIAPGSVVLDDSGRLLAWDGANLKVVATCETVPFWQAVPVKVKLLPAV